MNTTRVTDTTVAHVSQQTLRERNVTYHRLCCTVSKPTNCLTPKTTRTLFAYTENKIKYKNYVKSQSPPVVPPRPLARRRALTKEAENRTIYKYPPNQILTHGLIQAPAPSSDDDSGERDS
jgi:hypothetical protein